jgi:hypothetical protein
MKLTPSDLVSLFLPISIFLLILSFSLYIFSFALADTVCSRYSRKLCSRKNRTFKFQNQQCKPKVGKKQWQSLVIRGNPLYSDSNIKTVNNEVYLYFAHKDTKDSFSLSQKFYGFLDNMPLSID